MHIYANLYCITLQSVKFVCFVILVLNANSLYISSTQICVFAHNSIFCFTESPALSDISTVDLNVHDAGADGAGADGAGDLADGEGNAAPDVAGGATDAGQDADVGDAEDGPDGAAAAEGDAGGDADAPGEAEEGAVGGLDEDQLAMLAILEEDNESVHSSIESCMYTYVCTLHHITL